MRAAIRSAAVTLVAVLATGCGGDHPPPADAPSPQRAIETGAEVLSADGLPIVYDARGSGHVALVFVHGWAADRREWGHQMAELADAHRVVALDLPGHGESGASRAAWSVVGLGDDVARLVEELRLERVVLVGHAMGTHVALAAAARLPGRVEGVVCVESLQDLSAGPPATMSADLLVRLAEDFDGAMRGIVPLLVGEDAPPEATERALEMALEAPEEPALALLSDFPHVDVAGLATAAGVPIRCINAAPRPPLTPPTDVEGNREFADFDAELIEGVGHYPMLERPAEFDAALRRAVDSVLAAD